MILAVCPNLALDVTYQVDAFIPGSSVRVARARSRAGGKGANVARVAAALGEPSVLVGFTGGSTGRTVVDDLDASGLTHDLVAVDGDTRRTLTVVSPTEATVFNEPGPEVSSEDWDRLVDLVARRAVDASVVTVSGSLPPGSPADACARLVAASAAPVVLDTSAPGLLDALPHRPAVVKPNDEEAAALLGMEVRTDRDALAACTRLVDAGARACIITMGSRGLVALRDGQAVRVHVGRTVAGNPTGAGDAFTARLATGLARGEDWTELLRQSCAVAGAAVARDLAGEFDPSTYDDLLPHITIEDLR